MRFFRVQLLVEMRFFSCVQELELLRGRTVFHTIPVIVIDIFLVNYNCQHHGLFS
jgi:hypothetical protein